MNYLKIPNLVWAASRNDDSFSNMLLKGPRFNFWKQQVRTWDVIKGFRLNIMHKNKQLLTELLLKPHFMSCIKKEVLIKYWMSYLHEAQVNHQLRNNNRDGHLFQDLQAFEGHMFE